MPRKSLSPTLKSVGRPITLDTVACDFPELKLVGIHTGWPWTEEMIAVAYKHPNVYIGSDAYAPKHWAPEFVHFLNTFGQNNSVYDFDGTPLKTALNQTSTTSRQIQLGLKLIF